MQRWVCTLFVHRVKKTDYFTFTKYSLLAPTRALFLQKSRAKKRQDRNEPMRPGIINETEVINAFHEPASNAAASTKSKRHNCHVIMRILICNSVPPPPPFPLVNSLPFPFPSLYFVRGAVSRGQRRETRAIAANYNHGCLTCVRVWFINHRPATGQFSPPTPAPAPSTRIFSRRRAPPVIPSLAKSAARCNLFPACYLPLRRSFLRSLLLSLFSSFSFFLSFYFVLVVLSCLSLIKFGTPCTREIHSVAYRLHNNSRRWQLDVRDKFKIFNSFLLLFSLYRNLRMFNSRRTIGRNRWMQRRARAE